MSVADKLLQVNQVKQDIKQAIENKGVAMSGIPFTNYPLKISEISGGEISFNDIWQEYKGVIYDYKRSTELKYDLNLTFELLFQGVLDVYSGDSVLTQLYNDCVNGVIQVNKLTPIDNQIFPKVALMYQGDVSSEFGWPAPLYSWNITAENTSPDFYKSNIILSDLTSFGMGVGISILATPMDLKFTNIKIFKQYENYEQGLIADLSEVSAFAGIENADFPLYIVDNVEEIGDYAFSEWTSNNHPLVIPDSVTSIGNYAFDGWSSNNQPLVIPDSVTNIGNGAFNYWSANKQPLVIPENVTNIGGNAFLNWSLVPYIVIQAITPPTLGNANAFSGQNNAPIYVPDESVDAYKTATNWIALASRIFAVSEKP